MVADGHDADAFRKVVLDNFDTSLGAGLNKIKGKAFRIGHLGHLNDLTLMGMLAGIEMSRHCRCRVTPAASRRPWRCSRDATVRRC
jgi:aspartate aminotransferase-like enzyme